MNSSQQLKRKNNDNHNEDVKRINTTNDDMTMEEVVTQPTRPTTPPLSMTLSHYDASTGRYTCSQINSKHQVKGPICTGMTPVYRAPFERWGSCII